MKKILMITIGAIMLLLLSILICAAVISADAAPKNDMESAPKGSPASGYYSTIVIDSCEYIEAFNRLAHKGNCKFCAQRRKQELKQLVKELKE